MSDLSKFLVESILLGEASSVKDLVVVYSGRFQPFHKGHFNTYQTLVKKFGKNNVYIGTSDKTDNQKSPFNFKEKVKVMTTMFGIPSNKIAQVKNPYAPSEILSKFNKETTAFITVVGEKDSNRLGGKYFEKYKDGIELEGYIDRGYVFISPSQPNAISGTDVRVGLKKGSTEDKKEFFTKKAYGKFNQSIFDMIVDKLSKLPESVSIDEAITLDVEIGDTILMGRFKNKKVVVKTIGKDEHGMPTINGKKVATFRMIKEGLQVIFEDDNEDSKYTHIGHGVYKQKGKEGDESSPSFSKNDGGKYIKIDGTSDSKSEPSKGTKVKGSDMFKHAPDVKQKEKAKSEIPNVALDNVTKILPKADSDTFSSESDIPKISNKQQKQISMQIDKLVQLTNQAKENGEAAPNYNLCKITVAGTNLYCAGNAGIPREEMPQFKGKPTEGSPAASMEKDINGEVDTEPMFRELLKRKGIKTIQTELPSDSLKATQSELVGAKVAGMAKALESDPNHPKITAPIYVSRDGYVVDGHHRWAAVTTNAIRDGKPANMKVIVIDADIKDVIPMSNKFAEEIGVAAKKADTGKNESVINEIPMADLQQIDKYADKQLNPIDVVLTDKHFFDRLNDTRNGKEISAAELTGFFKRLGRNKKKFVEFLNQYHQVVAKDNRTNINIPFMQQANKAIAKTIMRKGEFKTTSPEYKFEGINSKNHKADGTIDHNFLQHHKTGTYTPDMGYGAELDTIDFDDTKLIEPGHQHNTKDVEDKGYEMVKKSVEEAYNKGEIFGGKIKIGGVSVPLEVELIGADNKKKVFITKVVHIDSKYHSKLPSNGILEIPARIFRTPGGGWYKVKTKSAFEGIGMGYPDQAWIDKHNAVLKRLRKKFNAEKLQYNEPYALSGGIAERVDGDTIICDKCGWNWKIEDSGTNSYLCHKCGHNTTSTLTEGLLTEGGAYGHMHHPFDTEINLTFGQLKNIVNLALEGKLELTREKTDGQALAISWVNGRLVAARNKGHLANRGEKALDINGVATKFAGRGELEKAYNFAMSDLSKAIKALSEKQREKIFKNGACFMNLEVIYPTSVNVIPYGQALLVFHGTMEYNEAGIAIGENQESAKVLAGMIKQVNQNVQSAYTIQGPPVVKLPQSKNLTSLKGKYNGQITKLQSKFKLSDTDGIADYHQAWWTDFVTKKSPSPIDNRTLMGLVKRWAFYDKSFRLDNKNITDAKVLSWAQGIDKNDHAKIAKDNIRPFEDIFLGVGSEVLSFMSSVLTANPDTAVRAMKDRLDKTISDVKTGGDEKKIAKLKMELQRLNAIGGKDKIVPNEGIVFVYNGNTMKLTGTFAPLNQILGLFYE